MGVFLQVAAAQGRLPGPSAGTTADGADLFITYCASCHGRDGTGHGPLARALRQAPSDLTQLSNHNGGVFPNVRVQRIIDGRDIESHGDREMPVWGDIFRADRDRRGVESAATRIAALVRYLESIQRRNAE